MFFKNKKEKRRPVKGKEYVFKLANSFYFNEEDGPKRITSINLPYCPFYLVKDGTVYIQLGKPNYQSELIGKLMLPVEETEDEVLRIISNEELHDCTTCKYGKYNDHWDEHFCYNNEECNNFELYEKDENIDSLERGK